MNVSDFNKDEHNSEKTQNSHLSIVQIHLASIFRPCMDRWQMFLKYHVDHDEISTSRNKMYV